STQARCVIVNKGEDEVRYRYKSSQQHNIGTILLGLWLLMFAHVATAATDFLTPDKAFTYHVTAEEDGAVLVTWDIVPDYYLYKHQFSITDEHGEELPQEWPEGEYIEDEFFGRSEVFFNQAVARVEPGDAQYLTLTW